nr:auxin transporter-like protein 2 [Ipomoea batatas]
MVLPISWTAYLISVLYVEYRSRKEKGVSFKNHVIQWFEVLDGLLGPYWKAVGLAFNCTFLLFGSVIQLIACACNIYYIIDRLDKRTWTYIFGACCATTVFIPSFHNYRIWSFLGLGMTTYTAWYLTIAAVVHGQAEGVEHSGPTKLVLYFTGATNILYTFGGHAVTVFEETILHIFAECDFANMVWNAYDMQWDSADDGDLQHWLMNKFETLSK